jgi:hypothetical protein
VRPIAEPAAAGQSELSSGRHRLSRRNRDTALPHVEIPGHVATAVIDDDVVGHLRVVPHRVHVRLAVVSVHHDAVEHGEDRHADGLFAEGADQRIVTLVAVIGVLGAIPVLNRGIADVRIEIGEIGDEEVVAENAGLRKEGIEERNRVLIPRPERRLPFLIGRDRRPNLLELGRRN